MSEPYHRRRDALTRFSDWFASPIYEALYGCSEWTLRGAVTTREARSCAPLPDGGTFIGSMSIEQQIRVDVKAGRRKWADASFRGARVGQPLSVATFVWTCERVGDDRWTISQIAPEAPLSFTSTPRQPLAGQKSVNREQ